MRELKERLLTDWHPMRMLRTGAGLIAGVGAIQSADILLGAVGVFLLYQGLMNTGCCGAMGCDYTPKRKQKQGIDEIEFEEISNK